MCKVITRLAFKVMHWNTPKLLGLNYKSKGEDNRRIRSGGILRGSQHFGVEGRPRIPRWD
jgi:hypothetical protein